MRLLCHGGAGGEPDEPAPRQAVLDEAAATGAAASTPVVAVESALNVLEDSPRFNAGVGGAVQSDGIVRTDAGIMTSARETGAVASLAGVARAVSAARVVMRETPHVLVTGRQAVDLAGEFEIETGVDLLTEETGERFADASPPDGGPGAHLDWVRDRFGYGGSDRAESGRDHDTVGAVAHDPGGGHPDFAAATSTGGRTFALAGRVGDVPQVGSGFYAAPAGAASATGAGEDIARVVLCRKAVGLLEQGIPASKAAELALDQFAEVTGSRAGLIVLTADGSGESYNSAGMQTSLATD